MKKIKIFLILFFCLFSTNIKSEIISIKDNCLKLYKNVKSSHEWLFGISYPAYFNLAQLKKETNCIWLTSKDGFGSVGYAQITPKFWQSEFEKMNIKDYKIKDSFDHFKAHAYINKNAYDSITKLCLDNQTKTKKLWAAFQGYNGSPFTLNKEIEKAKVCIYEESKKQCNRGIMCVWYDKDGKTCKQYRDRCDINYSYSIIIYKYGLEYAKILGEKYIQEQNKYKFW